jgi:hypothetical protein
MRRWLTSAGGGLIQRNVVADPWSISRILARCRRSLQLCEHKLCGTNRSQLDASGAAKQLRDSRRSQRDVRPQLLTSIWMSCVAVFAPPIGTEARHLQLQRLGVKERIENLSVFHYVLL